MLRLHGVSYRYAGATDVSLQGVDLELATGSVMGLAGPAEAGKSTLCLVVGGLAPRVVGGHLAGDVTIDGADVRDWPMHQLAGLIATGLQDPAGQLSHIAESVFDEVAFGPANLGLPRDEIVSRTERALELARVADLRDRPPERLSGGQQQLVVIAGLLAMQPRYLVLDEPVAHLDAAGTRAVLEALESVASAGAGILLAEQRTSALAAICDSVAVIADGSVIARGPVRDVLGDPALVALGLEELSAHRLRRLLREAGLDPALAEDGP